MNNAHTEEGRGTVAKAPRDERREMSNRVLADVTWRDLFLYVLIRTNPHYEVLEGDEDTSPSDFRWTCDNKLTFVEEFISRANDSLDREAILARLHDTGGHCACEIHWNSILHWTEKDLAERLPVK